MSTYDVVVIGGGMAGVSIAYECARDRKVLLVEGERSLARHTTGRSAAIYAPSYGPPPVRALTVASLGRLRALEAELDTPPLLTPRLVLWVGCDQDGVDAVHKACAESGVREISVAEAVTLCATLDPRALRAVGVEDGSMDVDVMALHQGYVRGLRGRQGVIMAGEPVTAIRADGDGWAVHVGAQRFSTDLVINAAGAWVDRVAESAGVAPIGIRPLRRTVAVASGPEPVDPAWPLVVDGADRFYFRPEGTRMLISPADETPSEPMDAKPNELDVALALERVNEVTRLRLTHVHTAWAGLRSFAPDGLPVVGARPEHPGFAFFAGQGGYGIQMAAALAELGAAIMLGRPLPPDIPVRPERLSP
jgi:D-arginine dehydrogenase